MGDGFRFDDPRQAALYAELKKIGDWPAAAFRDTCSFFATSDLDLETIAHLATHLQREIKSALTKVLLPLDFEPPSSGVKSKATRQEILATVTRAQKNNPNTPTFRELKKELSRIIKYEEKGDEATLLAILRVFELPENHALAQLWDDVGRLHSVAHRNALAAPRRLDDARDAWEAFQRLLTILLGQLDGAWGVIYHRIDTVLSAPPGKKQIKRLRNNIPNNPNTFRYFFNHAKTPEWIDAVTRDDSLFTDPPDDGYWPAIRYLFEIATDHAEPVHRIVTGLPSTPNVFTHRTIVQIADALPPHIGKDLLEKSATAFRDGLLRDPFIATDIANAAARIATTHAASALGTLRKLLALRRPTGNSLHDLDAGLELHTYIDVANATRAVSTTAARPTYDMLADLLDAALATVHPERGEDGSSGWMPAIEPHEQTHEYQALPVLAAAVRDAAEAAVTAAPDILSELVHDADRRDWFFFRRLALHLLRRDPKGEVARDHARAPDLLQNYALKHEARLLLRAVDLDQHDRDLIIKRILAGPADLNESFFTTPEQRQDYIEWWITQRLWWVDDWLTNEAKREYERLVAKHRVPDEHDDFVAWIGTMWVGPTSPKNAEELATMSITDIIAFLRSWQPTGQRSFGHSREGIARELQSVATKRAREFSEAATSFTLLDPTYIRGILNGLQSAVQNGQIPLAWENVIELSAFVVAQERAIEGRADDDGWDADDPHWGWTKSATARLLEAGFRTGPTQIPITLREKLWPVLLRVFDDPDPTPTRADNQASDPLTIALNSTRGQALRAIILYALWVRRSVPKDERLRDFSDAPEVRDTLTSILKTEPSAGVRAAFGELLHILHALDAEWVKDHLKDLFAGNEAHADAVFQTYIMYGQAHVAIDRLLLPQFDRAVAALPTRQNPPTHYTTHLAGHILWLCAVGEITLDNGALVDRFFTAATPETRSYAVGFAPSAARDIYETDDEAFRKTLEAFWAWCSVREDLAPAQHGFGLWMSEDKLDLTWRLTQLERALTIAGGVARDWEVIERLAQADTTHPALVLRCTRLLFDGANPMLRYTWAEGDTIRRIITNALGTTDPAVVAQARAFANHLVGLGFDGFLDLT